MTFHIVRLDDVVCPSPAFSIPHTYTSYPTTHPSQVASRVTDADIIITTRVPVTAETIALAPYLKLIAILAVGSDIIDLEACAKRGIQVSNVPAASNESVAEHAIALYFGLRRNLLQMHERFIAGDEWIEKGTLTEYFGGVQGTCKEEVMGIFGAGELGQTLQERRGDETRPFLT